MRETVDPSGERDEMERAGGSRPHSSKLHSPDQRRAYLFGLSAVLLWSTVASAFKLSLRLLTPDQLLLWASCASTLVLGLALIAQGRTDLLRQNRPRDIARSALLGFLNPFLYYVVLFRAYDRLPGQLAQPLNYTWALAIAILSIPLLKQRIGALSFLAIGISLFGVVVISTQGRLASLRVDDPLGVSLAVGSSLLWALFWILNLRDHRDERVKLFLSFCFGLAFTFVFCAATGQLEFPRPVAAAGAVYVGLFEMGLTFLLWLRALRLSKTTAAVSNLIFLSPFVSLFLLHWVVGEPLFLASFAGLICIVAGILLQQRSTARA